MKGPNYSGSPETAHGCYAICRLSRRRRSKLSEHVTFLAEQPLGVQAEAFKLASAAAEGHGVGEGVLGLRVLNGGGAMKAPLVRGIQVSQLGVDGRMGCEGVGSYRLSTAPQSHPPGENRSVCRRLLRSRADHTKRLVCPMGGCGFTGRHAPCQVFQPGW